jgi:isopentenyl phosphate kinase
MENIIKFGGSIVTSPSAPEFFWKENVRRLAEELAPHRHRSILLHGTGLVGKPHARKFNYLIERRMNPQQRLIALELRSNLRRLNNAVVSALVEAGIPAIPFDIIHCFDESMTNFRHTNIISELKNTIERGLTPVFYGDLMPAPDGSFRVFSSDAMCLILARALRPDNLIFLTDTDGVLASPDSESDRPRLLEELTPDTLHLLHRQESDSTDVSGGMSAKVNVALECARYSRNCIIANGVKQGVLTELLRGNTSLGTRIQKNAEQYAPR